MRIGFDLDNTIICYDFAFASAAIERGLLPPESIGIRKEVVKDTLYAEGDSGAKKWQALQGYIYGRGIEQASLFDGVDECMRMLTEQGHELFIISHKTIYGHFDETKTDLRDAARRFLRLHNITEIIPEHCIFFCASLLEKIAKISELRCNTFVDDLVNVLFHDDFPASSEKILFRSQETVACKQVMSWPELQALFETPVIS